MDTSPHKPRWSLRATLTALGIFAIASVVMTFPLALRMADTIENWGDPLLNTWILAWDLHQGINDPLHLYDANIFYPYTKTLAYSESLLASALLVAPVNLLSGNPVLAYNVLVLLSFILSGFTAYLLGRELSGSHAAGLVAGFVYAFSLYRFGEFSHVQLLTAQWMPLVVLYLGRFLRSGSMRTGLAFALFFCLQALSSFYYAFYLGIAVALYAALFGAIWLFRRQQPPAHLLPKTTLLVALIALVVVPPSLPYFDVEREMGMSRSLHDTIDGSAALENYVAVPANTLYARVALPLVSRTVTEETLFPGVVAVLLAVLALSWRRQHRLARAFLASLVAIAFVLSLGPWLKITIDGAPLSLSLPYTVLHEHLPGFKAMRVPARLAILVTLGLAGLGAIGAARLLLRLSDRRRLIATGGIVLLIAVESFAAPVRTTPIETGNRVPEVYRWLGQQADDGIIFEYPTVESRYLLYDWEMERLGRYQYLSAYHWHRAVTGYSGFFPPLFFDIQEQAQTFPDRVSISSLRGLGVKYVIVHNGDMPAERQVLVESRLREFAADLRPIVSFGADEVFLLTPGRPSGAPQVQAFLPSSAGTGADYRAVVSMLNTGDAAAVNPRHGPVQVRAQWRRPDGGTIVEQSEAALPGFAPKGLTTLAIPLKPPAPGEYELSLDITSDTFTIKQHAKVNVSPPRAAGARPDGATPEVLQVMGVQVPAQGYRAGDVVPVRVRWRAAAPLRKDYTIWVKLFDSSRQVLASVDTLPLQGYHNTTSWSPEETVDDLYGVILPPGIATGRYQIAVGAYALPAMDRPRLIDAGGSPVNEMLSPPIRVEDEHGRLVSDEKDTYQPSGRTLGDTVRLRGFWTDKQEVRPGERLRVAAYWEALSKTEADLTGFVHVVDATGKPVAQSDSQPANGRFPTSIWKTGDLVRDEREIVIPADLAPGRYELRAGMYLLPGPQPLLVKDRDSRDDANRVYLGDISVTR